MKIDAIGVSYNLQSTKNLKINQPKNLYSPPVSIKTISFRGGNKEQVIYWGMELRPYSALGGISTVLRDHRGLKASEGAVIPDGGEKNIEYWRQPDKVFVDPLYNGVEVYDYNTGLMQEARVGKIPAGLKEDSAFKKYEGMLFYTSDKKFKTYANELEFFNNEEKIVPATGQPKLSLNNNIHIIKEVGEPMKMDFGGDNGGETLIRLFRVHRFDSKTGELVPINDFKVMTDVSLTWKQPYEGGGYASASGALAQTWKGDGDARSSKAFVKLFKRICDEVSKDGKKFDPATLILNDSHAANVVEYMAQELVSGNEFLQGKKPEIIAHNLGAGYVQRTSYMNMFVNIADKELRDAVRHDPDFIDAVLQGNDAAENYFRKLLPAEMIDKQGGVSPFQNTIYYAEKGFVPKIITVSEGYHEASIANRDLVPGQFEQLKALAEKDIYVGITNGSTGINPYQPDKNPYFNGYTFPEDIEGIDNVKGKTLSAYQVFDKELAGKDSAKFSIEHVRSVKQHNKAALLERFDKDVLKALQKMKSIEGKEYEYASVIAAVPGKDVKVLGHIDKKFIEEAKKPNNNVKLLISWGRGDTQKGLDSVLNSFAQYVEKFSEADPNVVLIAGGELPDNEEGNAIKAIIEKMNNNPKTKGRFVFMNGFAPNKPLIMAADFSVLPSRFAPCELTDLESIKGLCPPIVSNCQGLGQKNFDATFDGEAGKVTGYKTKHDYYMSLEELKSLMEPKDKEKFEKEFQKFKDEISKEHQHKFNKVLTDEEIMEKIIEGKHYDYMFKLTRPYRDKIIEKELVDSYVRALQTDYGQEIQTRMIQNDVKLGIGWEDNAALSKFKKTSGQLYREAFGLDAGTIKEEDTLLYKLKQNCKEILEKYKNKNGTQEQPAKINWGEKLGVFFHSPAGKYTIAGTAVAAVAGLAYYGYKNGVFSSSYNLKDEKKHLSCIG